MRSFLSVFVVVVMCAFVAVDGFFFTVPATKEECFFEELSPGIPVTFMFQVTEGGFLDVDIQIRGPDGRVIYNQERQTEGRYNFQAHTTGRFAFCFGNRMSTLTPKTVGMLLDVGQASKPKQDTATDLAKPENIGPLENAVTQLSEGMNAVINEQNYMKMRERAHRNTSESTNSRVVWWSIFEIVILLAMSLWQIYYLRRFFEVKRIV